MCKWFGHKWIPVYVGGNDYNFIGVYCERCHFGYDDLLSFIKQHQNNYNTYNYKYWKGQNDPTTYTIQN